MKKERKKKDRQSIPPPTRLKENFWSVALNPSAEQGGEMKSRASAQIPSLVFSLIHTCTLSHLLSLSHTKTHTQPQSYQHKLDTTHFKSAHP